MTKYLIYISNNRKRTDADILYDTASNLDLARKKASIVSKRAIYFEENYHEKAGWTYAHIVTSNGKYVGTVTPNKSADHLLTWTPVKGSVAFIDKNGRIY